MKKFLLAIDQGTTNSRAIIFDPQGKRLSEHEIALKQSFPKAGWVEQDPEEMFENVVTCCRNALQKANLAAPQIAAIGISNQRETTIIWHKQTGKPIYPAIVWQDRRTSDLCREFAKRDIHAYLSHATGLLLDPYFSATKIWWILENVPNARKLAMEGELLFGTVDSYLIWRMSGNKIHVTDASNASRTLLFNIRENQWDQTLLKIFDIPEQLLPIVLDCAAEFAFTAPQYFGDEILIGGVLGDQQAATVGQGCFKPGMMKATYGTGGFLFLNTGEQLITSHNRLLSTIAYRLKGNITYGLEGSIFSAGETVKWLRDQMGIIQTASQTELMARQVESTDGVYLIPAFTGLGAPYWEPEVRAAIYGIERSTTANHIVRAALECVAYQTQDLITAMQKDHTPPIERLRVDGGMMANNWLMQFLADILQQTIERSTCIETSALGAAYMAGLQVGIYHSLEEIAALWELDKAMHSIMPLEIREQRYAGWGRAVQTILHHSF